MIRRTTPAAKRDDDAFPVRIKLAVPGGGLGSDLGVMMAWLRANLPSHAFAVHSARSIGGSAMAAYFLRIEDAGRFLEAFPARPLATPPGISGHSLLSGPQIVSSAEASGRPVGDRERLLDPG